MPLKSEILRVVRRVDETGTGTIQAVRELWDDMSLSRDERKELMQEALAARVNDALRRSYRRASIERSEEEFVPMDVKVEVTTAERPVMTVNVEILERVSFDIRGQRRKIIDLTMDDTDYLLARSKALIRGQERASQFYKYAQDQMKEQGVSVVRQLKAKEKRTLAAMLQSVEEREDFAALPAPK